MPEANLRAYLERNPSRRFPARTANVDDKMNGQERSDLVAPVRPEWTSQDSVHLFVRTAATAFGIYLCCRLAAPVLPALAWALALAVLFAPLQKRLQSKLGDPRLTASLLVLVVGLIVVVPVTFVGQQLVVQAVKGTELIESKLNSGELHRALESQPRLARIASRIERRMDLPGIVKNFASWLSTTVGSIVKGSVIQVVDFCLTLYFLFFLFRDREPALESVRALSPLSPSEMDHLLTRISDTIFATVYGTLAVAGIQGFLGGLIFWWLGLPAPLLWGVVMALLAVVPVLGAFVVWIPAAIFLALQGAWGKSLILVIWGALVIGTIDNLIAPIVVGTRLKLHTVPAFISLVGGLFLFGPAGLILGPVILTSTLFLMEIWPKRNGTRTFPKVKPADLFSRLEKAPTRR